MDAVMACESFIKDCDELYASYLISSMFATEGVGMDNIKRMAHQAWEAIKSLVRRIGEALAKAGAAVGGLFKKIGEARKKIPNVFKIRKKDAANFKKTADGIKDAKWFEDGIDDLDDVLEAINRNSDELQKIVDAQSENASKVEEAISETEVTFTEKEKELMRCLMNGESVYSLLFESYGLAMEADDNDDVGSQQVNAGPLRDILARVSEKCHHQMTKVNATINSLKAKIAQASSDETASGIKKQKLFARLLKMVSAMGGKIKSVASSISKMFSNLITMFQRGKTKSTVSDYNGPEPEFT